MTTAPENDTLTAADLAAQALLGALLWDPHRAGDISGWLAADDFYRPAHGAIYATLVGMLADGRPDVDVFTVLESLGRGEYHDGRVGRTVSGPLSAPELHSLISMTPATPRAEDIDAPARSDHVRYARIVQEDSIRRQVQALGTRIEQYARHVSDRDSDEAADTVVPVLGEAQTRLRELAARLGAAGVGRASIAAALNPAPRPAPTPPRTERSERRRPSADVEHLRRAEYRLIGACLMSDEVRRLVDGRLRSSDFTVGEVAATWVAITALQHRGEPVDFVLVAHQIEQQGALPDMGRGLRPDHLQKLATRSYPADGFGPLETVVHAALTRHLNQAHDQLQNLATDHTRSSADVIRAADQVIEHTTTATHRLTATSGSRSAPVAPGSAESETQQQPAGPGAAVRTKPTGVRALTDPERTLLADRLRREPARLAPSRALDALRELGLAASDSQRCWHVTALGRLVAAEQRIVSDPGQGAPATAAAAVTPPAVAVPAARRPPAEPVAPSAITAALTPQQRRAR